MSIINVPVPFVAPPDIKDLAAQFLVLVTCRDEKDQVEVLARLKEEGAGVQGAVGVMDRGKTERIPAFVR
jgi:hypothetical protein